LCWDWQPLSTAEETEAVIDKFLREAGVRPWQRQLADPVLTEALFPDPTAAETIPGSRVGPEGS
jgi:ribonuclease D